MNKAVSWNVDGAGFDARDAARGAARDQGESLGDLAAGRDEVSRRVPWDGDDDLDRESSRRRCDRAAIETAEIVFEEAIEALDRRAQRAERRTDKMLQSMAELLHRNESRHERERGSIAALTGKLADIEARLGDPLPRGDDLPVKSARSRFEARLDAIGGRSGADGPARQRPADDPLRRPGNASGHDLREPESLHRLEEKLNSILHAVRAEPDLPATGASSVAMAASQAANDRTRLGKAINEITQRQQSLDDGVPPTSLRDAILRRHRAEAPAPRDGGTPPVGAAQTEISTLASKIDDLRRDVVALNQVRQRPFVDLDAMRGEIGAMAEVLRELASRGPAVGSEMSVPAAVEAIVSPDALAKIETKIERLAAKIDAVVDGAVVAKASPMPGTAALEGLVRDLERKMEAVQAPGAGHEALDALQSQIADLSARFERSDNGLGQLASLERSMHDLFAHIEETRASVETSAQHAAREVLRIAVEEGRAQTEKGAATSLATMQALQEDADARTSETLSAVHETLEKVVERLTVMETDLAEVRGRPQLVQAPAAQGATPDGPAPSRAAPVDAHERQGTGEMSLGAPDPLIDPMLTRRATKPLPAVSSDKGGEARRAGFIAAARRAAKAAQSDPWLADFRRPSTRTEPESATRAGLIEQSRDYVARHKRPVLLSIAALFVIVGTLAIVERIGLEGFDIRVARATSPAPVLRAVDPRPLRSSPVLMPSALPRTAPSIAKAIPGSDPIQTGSIPSLPSFAVQTPAARTAALRLPEGLETMAKAGDRAAEYVLGAHYAEGRLVPRDFKAAASWYRKAADQGSVPAQYRLASLYEKGLGVIQDRAKARSLYLRAAEAGNPRAMHNLAVMLADGDGHPDYEGAATWFRKAAQFGIHDSQYNLAILLARGLGTQQSFILSYQWFSIAAAQNDVDAGRKRDEVATRLSSNDLAVAKALAAAFRPRIADTAAVEVAPPPGGWDGAAGPSPLNSPRSKISML